MFTNLFLILINLRILREFFLSHEENFVCELCNWLFLFFIFLKGGGGCEYFPVDKSLFLESYTPYIFSTKIQIYHLIILKIFRGRSILVIDLALLFWPFHLKDFK